MINVWFQLWFWWLGLTTIYTGLVLNEFLDGGILGHITGFTGLFVPVGPLSLLSPYLVITAPLTLFGILVGEHLSYKQGINKSASKQVVFNLVYLLFLTLIVDLVQTHTWMSLLIFWYGEIPIKIR